VIFMAFITSQSHYPPMLLKNQIIKLLTV